MCIQFRFNVRGLLSTNADLDRRLFHWDGSNHTDLYPSSPSCIAVEAPGKLEPFFSTKKYFLVVKRLFCDRVASKYPIPVLTGSTHLTASYSSYI